MKCPQRIDLHMHTTVSDGTDTPEEILGRVRDAGLELFSVTDHDAVKGCLKIQALRRENDPMFLPGVEFSCKDEQGQYHILGYGYDPDAASIQQVVDTGHRYRMKKVQARLDFLNTQFGFSFPKKEQARLLALDNPGKPHIGNLMVKYGFAATKEEAIKRYIDQIHFQNEYVRPEEAIQGILNGGGIPVLAHPSYGSGDQIIVGEKMDKRLRRLIGFGLEGVETYYSGFTAKLTNEILGFAERYDLYVTAGSDYHGTNKLVELGDTGLTCEAEWPAGLRRFLAVVCERLAQ